MTPATKLQGQGSAERVRRRLLERQQECLRGLEADDALADLSIRRARAEVVKLGCVRY